MVTPNMGNKVDLTETAWAADTGLYSTKGERAFHLLDYLRWLEQRAYAQETCLFATAPDVVCDARQTWGRSRDVLPLIRELGFPAAYVLQNGYEETPIDWDAFDVLFLGGDNSLKAADLFMQAVVREARARGKRVHMGRVNGLRRLSAARVLGCDSADGTYLGFGPDVNWPKMRRWVEYVNGGAS